MEIQESGERLIVTRQSAQRKEITKEDVDTACGIIDLCTGTTDTGKEFYAYVSIPPSKYAAYRAKQLRQEEMDLEEFGEVIHSGWGTSPPPDIMAEMEHIYHVIHTLEDQMREAVNKKLAEKD